MSAVTGAHCIWPRNPYAVAGAQNEAIISETLFCTSFTHVFVHCPVLDKVATVAIIAEYKGDGAATAGHKTIKRRNRLFDIRFHRVPNVIWHVVGARSTLKFNVRYNIPNGRFLQQQLQLDVYDFCVFALLLFTVSHKKQESKLLSVSSPDCCGGLWRPVTFSSENWHSIYSCVPWGTSVPILMIVWHLGWYYVTLETDTLGDSFEVLPPPVTATCPVG